MRGPYQIYLKLLGRTICVAMAEEQSIHVRTRGLVCLDLSFNRIRGWEQNTSWVGCIHKQQPVARSVRLHPLLQ